MRRNKVGGLMGVTALLLMVTAGAPATAQPERPERGGTVGTERRATIAWFEGRPLDLSRSWGEAQACLVWRQGGILECFRTSEELDARAADLSPERMRPPTETETSTTDSFAAYSSWSCSSSLKLFDYTWYGGRQLSFWDRGFWQNLWDYGFDERTSSYIVGGCYVQLALHHDGGGLRYPGPTYPYAGEPVMYSTWPNAVSSIYIE